jgi:beta-glucanase (GH16 family)
MACSSNQVAYFPTSAPPTAMEGYSIVWHDEFDGEGKPDSTSWSYEKGFVRNNELQWYQAENANVANGVLVIEGKREQVNNSRYEASSQDWRRNRQFAEYTSASINTRGKRNFQYGIMAVRAKIDTAMGMWPAIWTLGESKPWPANGEIDVMEFYQVENKGTILANAAWAGENRRAVWDEQKIPITHFIEKDPE